MSRHERVRFLFRKSVPVGLILVSTVVALLFGELLVRFVVNPGDFLLATLVDDPILVRRIKPHTTGHDALGFRNRETPERANIVAIGDSMTYGVNAGREGSWPHQLGTLLKEPIYSMSLGGYGPLEYMYLAENEARKLRPRLLLVGFYFGNDLIDACRSAQRPYWHNWRQGSSNDCRVEDQQTQYAGPKKSFGAVRDWLSRHSVIYSLIRVALLPRLALWEQDRAASRMAPERQMIWADPSNNSIRSIFTHQFRLSLLDPQLPQVQEGMRITKQAFSDLKRAADAQGMRPLVVLLPTKERVYCRYLQASGERMPKTFVRLCEAEERVKQDLVQFFLANNIQYVDVTAAMEEEISKHVQIYPTGSDGHPLVSGYNVIARAVYDAVGR